jgi:hypothetical protein
VDASFTAGGPADPLREEKNNIASTTNTIAVQRHLMNISITPLFGMMFLELPMYFDVRETRDLVAGGSQRMRRFMH